MYQPSGWSNYFLVAWFDKSNTTLTLFVIQLSESG